MLFDTIHIFGFGTVQLADKQVPATSLTKLSAFVEHIKSFRDVVDANYHVIHVFNNSDVKYLGRCTSNRTDKISFQVKWADVNKSLLSDLVDEIKK